ncbi:hypothetical protein FE257_000347 [Aspergillus nanangensis]|uniref:Sulfate transporter family protein n=1 Tax=Aspergillus nanangensis TaxID=2582783 RepID=A0AAD4CZ75_ASPNN|nr:hypothetical protein FE257_000347 [Aspergillus nanangensis]
MGVLRPQRRSGSPVSGFSPHCSSSVDDIVTGGIDIPVEHASHGSPPRNLGIEPLVSGGSSYRTRSRSVYHRPFINTLDPAHYSSNGLREQSAELASFALSLHGSSPQERNPLPPSLDIFQHPDDTMENVASPAETVVPLSDDPESQPVPATGSSVLTEMIHDLRENSNNPRASITSRTGPSDVGNPTDSTTIDDAPEPAPITEQTSLLSRTSQSKPLPNYGLVGDVENQSIISKRELSTFQEALSNVSSCFRTLANPKSWDKGTVWKKGMVDPISLLPAVFLGLLLNILDALSYGMILFPLGEPIFSDLGSDGISMFYVRGVGFFLMKTGVEVSARLPGSFDLTAPTLHKLFQIDTVPLWIVPLVLSIGLLVAKRFMRSNFLVGGYFIAVAIMFYIVKFGARESMDNLRHAGWVFDAPSSSNPWWHFYTLYDFSAVDWTAFADTIPAMFALTFFGILHVPINVPALGISTGEDNLNVDRELMAHGITNAVSGFAGSIQNYLVYTNSLMFIGSGGNSRLAGIMLAVATVGILFVGPVIVGFIPVMVVGALIFLLGIELMEEALVDTWGRLHRHEYVTVVIIVVTMGAWDFVVGILVGIILACLSYVVQTSQKSAIRATYSGKITGSTVRRPPIQQRFLNEAGQQTLIIKLGGYLFFGTIVNVENTMRGLIEEEAFNRRPIRFLILDFSRVYGLDFSAAEAFTRINRVLRKRHVQMTISGLDVEAEVGRSLQNVGLFEPETGVQIFEDLNSALEFCENNYLKVFYSYREALLKRTNLSPTFLEVPVSQSQHHFGDGIVSSPRHRYLQQAATTTLHENESAVVAPAAWTAMRQPLPLLLQTFQGLTSRNEDFWFPACGYFARECYTAGTVLFEEGDMPNAFYLLESGMLRAEYELPQGRYFELIVAGRPCGELPFFSETRRTARVKAEQDCVAWCLNVAKWQALREQEPEIARELLTVSLKLTTERMDSITSYVLTMAA